MRTFPGASPRSSRSPRLSGVDLTETRLPNEEHARLALFGDGLFAAGRIVFDGRPQPRVPASGIYLRAPKPRA